ncbi:MAG: flagellin [Planctomycetota bacterium]
MSRINSNVDSLIAQNSLNKTNKALGVALTRLSTGVRVNSGADDPAALIGGEFFRQELSSIKSAITNSNRTNNVLTTADAALGQISNLFEDIKGVLTSSANSGVLSNEEVEANQAFIDSALDSVDRIATNTQFAGKKLLDGSLSYQLSGITYGSTGLQDIQVNQFSGSAGTQIDVTYTTVAARATADLAGFTTGNAQVSFQVVGSRGAATVSLGATANATDLAAAVNAVSDVTGISASGTTLTSVDYGSDAFVTLRDITGGLVNSATAITGNEFTDTGVDAAGTIEGQAFNGKGLNATLRTAGLDISIEFGATATAGGSFNFTINGGGTQFQLGQEINAAGQLNLGIRSFSSASLGTNAIGRLDTLRSGSTNDLSSGNFNTAGQILESATNQVSTARARLGAIQKNTLETNVSALQVAFENITASRSALIDTDFAQETANLTRLQIVAQAGTSALSIANSRPQNVLSLLG